ncbi:tautomerase family protein [Scandinavium goeteborgense]|uniref:tautomerase family protein n=1 Tax=Scandinavium goeteborgense TaxID=1851514 RepID=UPI0021652256|nr:tautomerase family protein [Scandinavium goeteborgense]MCS2152182.1 tautomerase family protein [Scandinavium goeteborgense]
MPLLQIDLLEGRNEKQIKKLLDVIHQVALVAFGVPERDRYQIVNEHKPHLMHFEDTGLGFSRTDNLVMIRVFTSPRSVEQKHTFMRLLAEEMKEHCGVQGEDLMVSFFSNEKHDWSFAFGEAQFATGKL